MPVLKNQKNELYISIDKINEILAPNYVAPFGVTNEMKKLAETATFNDELKEKLISMMPKELVQQYRENNLIRASVFIARQNMDEATKKKISEYFKPHINNFDEIHHFVGGAAIFGFVNQLKQQVVLILLPGDKLFIKQGSEHWSHFTKEYTATVITYKALAISEPSVVNTDTPILISL